MNADLIIERHRRRMLGRPSYADATEQYQWETLRRTLRLVEAAMEDEGVLPDIRDRVLHTVVFGAPSSADADLRAAQAASLVAHMTECHRPAMRLPFSPG